VYSLNVPVPGEVERLAAELHPRLLAFDRIRDRRTLVCKRFEGERSLARLRERLREPLAGAPAFEVRVAGIDYFETPARGPGPVVYLAVESPGLLALHDRLCDAFGAIEGIEGDDYVPHVTLARGGSLDAATDLRTLEIEPVTWTASSVTLWNAKFRESAATIRLPR
jgi:2'-5' RNA ligase